jgi:DNA-binding transcriptional ArsR family regulator
MAMKAKVSEVPARRPEPDMVVPDQGALQAASSLFRGLGDPSRLAILSHLLLGEHRVVELTEHLGLAQSTVSAHLRCLLDCGMVELRAVGRASVYSVRVEPEILAVLAAAERLLAATGDAVVLCPVYGTGAQAGKQERS